MFALIGTLFNEVFMKPVVNLLVLIYRAVEGAGIPGALGLSVVIMTILIRFLVWPFIASQLKASRKMSELQPQLQEIKRKYKGDKTKISQEQMKLYKEHGVNPAGGCVPSLIQLPVVIALYQTISSLFNGTDGLNHINSLLYSPAWHLDKVPDTHFLGINLILKPSEFMAAGWGLLLIPVITAVLQLIQSKMMMPTPVKPAKGDSTKEVKEKIENEDTMAAVQGQMLYMMPLMIGYFAFQFPIGLAIYWNTFTLIGILQQYLISGWGGLTPWLRYFKK